MNQLQPSIYKPCTVLFQWFSASAGFDFIVQLKSSVKAAVSCGSPIYHYQMFFLYYYSNSTIYCCDWKNHRRNVANWLEKPEQSWTAGFTLAPVSAQAPWIEHQHWLPPGARWPGSQARWRQILVPHRQRWHYLSLPWPGRRNPCGARGNFHQRMRTMTTILSLLTRIFLLIPNSLEPKSLMFCSQGQTAMVAPVSLKTPWFVCSWIFICTEDIMWQTFHLEYA